VTLARRRVSGQLRSGDPRDSIQQHDQQSVERGRPCPSRWSSTMGLVNSNVASTTVSRPSLWTHRPTLDLVREQFDPPRARGYSGTFVEARGRGQHLGYGHARPGFRLDADAQRHGAYHQRASWRSARNSRSARRYFSGCVRQGSAACLTLSGAATLAAYQTALHNISFSNSDSKPPPPSRATSRSP